MYTIPTWMGSRWGSRWQSLNSRDSSVARFETTAKIWIQRLFSSSPPSKILKKLISKTDRQLLWWKKTYPCIYLLTILKPKKHLFKYYQKVPLGICVPEQNKLSPNKYNSLKPSKIHTKPKWFYHFIKCLVFKPSHAIMYHNHSVKNKFTNFRCVSLTFLRA